MASVKTELKPWVVVRNHKGNSSKYYVARLGVGDTTYYVDAEATTLERAMFLVDSLNRANQDIIIHAPAVSDQAAPNENVAASLRVVANR